MANPYFMLHIHVYCIFCFRDYRVWMWQIFHQHWITKSRDSYCSNSVHLIWDLDTWMHETTWISVDFSMGTITKIFKHCSNHIPRAHSTFAGCEPYPTKMIQENVYVFWITAYHAYDPWCSHHPGVGSVHACKCSRWRLVTMVECLRIPLAQMQPKGLRCPREVVRLKPIPDWTLALEEVTDIGKNI